ncbi:hypothetical protein OROHE_014407 [Orobanche hederae]
MEIMWGCLIMVYIIILDLISSGSKGLSELEAEARIVYGFRAGLGGLIDEGEESSGSLLYRYFSAWWFPVWVPRRVIFPGVNWGCYTSSGETDQYICYIAYPLDFFEEGSVTNMFTSIIGNVFGFKALRALRLEDLRIPPAYIKIFQSPPHEIQVERDKLNKNRFLFCAEAIYKTQAETGKIKGHYLNTTAGTCEEMIKRAEDSLQILAWLIIAIIMAWPTSSPAMHAVIDRQKNHGIHFRVLAKALRMSGGDHIHLGIVVGKLEGERDITFDFVDILRDDFIEKDRSRDIYFTQDWVSLPGVIPVASGGIHVWLMPSLTEIFGDDSILQFGGGTLGHPWGNAPGVVAIEAYVQARNEGRDLAAEDNAIIREASKGSPELVDVCEVWKEIKFKFKAVDTLDKSRKTIWKDGALI